ncbi:hypothetical protein M5K25_001356 [Dendrobium thyrsiflorum]|uniref:Uncharacterized protein n=1 Tax=Dendrobium thyrsiflorum TaxID=117978 RepID=A0ABD0W0B1_DENTH
MVKSHEKIGERNPDSHPNPTRQRWRGPSLGAVRANPAVPLFLSAKFRWPRYASVFLLIVPHDALEKSDI